jgi:hypothetical protein
MRPALPTPLLPRTPAARKRARTNKVTRYEYKSAHWQRVRKQRPELASNVCELKLAGCTIRATHVHLPAGYEGEHPGSRCQRLPRLVRLLLRRYRWSTQPLLLDAWWC